MKVLIEEKEGIEKRLSGLTDGILDVVVFDLLEISL